MPNCAAALVFVPAVFFRGFLDGGTFELLDVGRQCAAGGIDIDPARYASLTGAALA